MTNLPKSRNKDLVALELEKEILIYVRLIDKTFCRNLPSAIAFHLCNGKNSLAEIADLISTKLKIFVSEDFVWLVIEE